MRRRLNQRVTGSPDEWPIDWLAREWIPNPFPRALSLGCGEGALELRSVQLPGKRAMDAASLLRGFAIPLDAVLGEAEDEA